jgi:ribonuclease E
MPKRILIDAVYPEETRVVIHENNLIQEFDYEAASKKQIKGNIYLAKITRVEPSLQAAFIEYGADKHGFLPFSEIHPDYFQVPVNDRKVSVTVNQDDNENVNISDEDNGLPIQLQSIEPPVFSQEDSEEEIVHVKDINGNFAAKINYEELILNDVDEDIKYEPSTALEQISVEKLESSSSIVTEVDENISDEDNEDLRGKQNNPYRNHRIQDVIKKNQVILIQVIKEERGNKGATFTSFISLAGRYCVLMPNSERQGGISKRIDDIEDRKRLKSIIDGLNTPTGASVIVRTAGAAKSKVDIKRDYDYLVRLWNSIREHIITSKAPAFIHAEGDLIKRTIRDLYDDSIDEILVQGDLAFKKAKDFIKMIIPTHASKVKQYKSKTPIFCRYQIDDQLSALYSPIAHLDSGGYIVINQTEALIAIDVNSGKSTSERNIEETATKTNLEAVYEIGRQLRLRDLSGLVVIDFIDMLEIRNRRLVEKALKETLQFDRAKIQMGSISSFGLLEMSRQRLRPSFIETNTVQCPHCNGKGIVRASESNAVLILRTIESEIHKSDFESVSIFAHPEVVIYMLNNKRNDIGAIEVRYNTKLIFCQDNNATGDSFGIERVKRVVNTAKGAIPINIEPIYDDGSIQAEEEQFKAKKRNWKSPKNIKVDEPKVSIESNVEVIDEGESFNRKVSRIGGRRDRRNIKKRVEPSHKEPNIIEQASVIMPVSDDSTNDMAVLEKKLKNNRRPYRSKRLNRSPKNNPEQKDPVTKTESGSLLKGLWKRITE